MTQDVFEIVGGTPLRGEIRVQGAKNSVLPVLAATILCRGVSEIENTPCLSDVDTAGDILAGLGCAVRRDGSVLYVDSSGLSACEIPDHLMRKMRSSVFFLGAILGTAGECTLTYPGGCELGPRPIDIHLSALQQLGVRITEAGGKLHADARRLHGAAVSLPFPSVGATENVLLAACAAPEDTWIINAAREPEIVDLAKFLSLSGAEIRGAGTPLVEIRGGKTLHPARMRIMPDRIAAATWLCAVAATGGDLFVREGVEAHLQPVVQGLRRAGCAVTADSAGLFISAPGRLRGGQMFTTAPYPGFPTDAQAILMAAMCCAEGVSVFVENIFESRFRHVCELARMGAKIRTEGKCAAVCGVPKLKGASVCAGDLRGGAALTVAALAAEGKSVITDIFHIDRGYENVVQSLNEIGANVRRISRDAGNCE